MSKVAQRYLDVDPWVVRERGFHAGRSRISESVFSVGNEFMGVRGCFEEGYGGQTTLGSYFNGLFEEEPVDNFFKGLVRRTHFIINAVDWLHTRIALDGETLNLARCRFHGFVRALDLRTGVLCREFVWTTRRGRKLKLSFERFTSMRDGHLGCQRIVFMPLNFSGAVRVEMGLNAATVCELHGRRNFFSDVKTGAAAGGGLALLARIERSGQRVMAVMRTEAAPAVAPRTFASEKFIGRRFDVRLQRGQASRVDRIVTCSVEKDAGVPSARVWRSGLALAKARAGTGWEQARAAHAGYWQDVWNKLDVRIEGDPENQQGIRFSIFQLHQTYHGADPGNNVAAKGLTSESYWGVTWWDTETYCLPFYLFNNPDAARNLLLYRYSKLPQACERARQKDCEGARYPMCTIDGTEACATWQHGDLEIHVSAAVAYGVWHYVNVTGDKGFLHREGIEMLLQISRYYASRGQWAQRTGDFGFWFVMGPDEFHMGVSNNCYTNVMAKKTFEWTLQTVREMRRAAPALLKTAADRVGLRPGELADWRRKASAMRIRRDRRTGVYEQHDGYFDAPHLECSRIPATDFPLYHHWAYFRLFRWDMIKQPDVLLLHLFFSHDYDLKNKRANYAYYEPRCSHESSLSPGVHSILAVELGLHAKAYAYWRHAARLDLDDYNRNTHEGLHTTSMAAAWLNVVYGFGGMRSDGKMLSFAPSLPARWRSFAFRVLYRGSVLKVNVDRRAVALTAASGPPVRVEVFGRPRTVTAAGIRVPMPAGRVARAG